MLRVENMRLKTTLGQLQQQTAAGPHAAPVSAPAPIKTINLTPEPAPINTALLQQQQQQAAPVPDEPLPAAAPTQPAATAAEAQQASAAYIEERTTTDGEQ
jgi:hypothetical protein